MPQDINFNQAFEALVNELQKLVGDEKIASIQVILNDDKSLDLISKRIQHESELTTSISNNPDSPNLIALSANFSLRPLNQQCRWDPITKKVVCIRVP